MPGGCHFICHNENCQHKNSGFALTGAWPLANIGLVINCSDVKKNEAFRDELIKLKNQGRKHAQLRLPNTDNIPVEGYRFTMWCSKCYCMWQNDFFFDEKSKTAEDLLANNVVPKQCPKCDSTLQSFEEITKEGIPCPHCKQTLFQSRWFSNEEIKD